MMECPMCKYVFDEKEQPMKDWIVEIGFTNLTKEQAEAYNNKISKQTGYNTELKEKER